MKRTWMVVRAAGVLVAVASGCAMIAGLDNEYELESASPSGGGGGGGATCMTNDDCPPSTECTTWACSEGACVMSAAPDGTLVAAGAIPGDCKKNVCQGGEPAAQPDDTDLVADNDPCTEETCMGGVKQAGPAPDGTPCDGALACVNGLCQGCNQNAANCAPPSACQVVECPVNECVVQPKPVGTKVGDNNQTGDCKALFCDGNGGVTEGVDDADVPVDPDPGDCVYPTCVNGVLNPGAVKATGDVCTSATDGKCCGTTCCQGASAGLGQFCDKDNFCCSSGTQCNGKCCANADDICWNNSCCQGNLCDSQCCPTDHACDSTTGGCCPFDQQCGDGACVQPGEFCP